MSRNKRVYLDTSVISALFDQRTPERKKLTESAWNNFVGYEVCISEIVLEELNAAPEKLRAKFINVVAEFKVPPIC